MPSSGNLQRLKSAALLGEVFVLAWLTATEDLHPVGILILSLVAASAVAVLVTYDWPSGSLLVLVTASAMPRFAGTVVALHVRPEHVAVGFVALALFFRLLSRRLEPCRYVQPDFILIAFVALNFLSSGLTSPQPQMTLRWATLNAIVISPYFLIRMLLKDEERLYKAFQALLWVGAAESAFGIGCFLSNRFFQTNLGVDPQQYGGFIPGTYGTQYEPNVFGSYAASCAVMFLTFYLLTRESRRSRYAWGCAICLLGSLISMARSVVLALLGAALFVIFVTSRQIQLRTLLRLSFIIGLLLLAFSPLLVSFISERFSTIDLGELSSDSTALNRLVQTAAAIQNIRAHPVLGTGTSSFQLTFNWDDYGLQGMKGDNEEGGWISNTPVRILHDTGTLGFAVFTSFLISLAVATRNAIRIANQKARSVILALSGGLVLYAITFQATEATLLAFTWVHLGLLVSAISVVKSQKAISSSMIIQ